jgi:hypothetical protein
MKKVILFAFLALTLSPTLNSCSKDDDAAREEIVTAPFEGEWTFSKEGEIVNGQEVLNDYNHSISCAKDYLVITSDGKANFYYYTQNTCAAETDSYNWVKINSKNYTFSDSFESFNVEVLHLTKTELKIKFPNGEIFMFTK